MLSCYSTPKEINTQPFQITSALLNLHSLSISEKKHINWLNKLIEALDMNSCVILEKLLKLHESYFSNLGNNAYPLYVSCDD